MNNELDGWGQLQSRPMDEAELQARVGATISSVYLWMTGALAITGLVAYWVASNTALVRMLLGWPFFVLMGIELVLVFALSSAIGRISYGTALAGFLLYSAINGVTLCTIFWVYTYASISSTFFIAGAMFGTMALVGHVTKANLSSLGGYLLMALIGLIIAGVVNIFLKSSVLDWIVSIAGVLIFVGLSAYDAQKIRQEVEAAVAMEASDLRKVALMGSLSLYLDFINLFLYLLRLMGRRK